MKYTNHYGLWFFAGIFVLLALTGCNNGKTAQDFIVSPNLTVKTVADTTIISGVLLDSGIVSGYKIGAKIDYPTNGPQPLTDSVRQFVIRELYRMFDWGDVENSIHIPFEKVCEWKDDNIVTDFLDNYGPLYEKEVMGVGADYLGLKMVAQTETFVTYFGEYASCGVSCSIDYCYYTFRKQDGRLLKEIVSKKGMRAFLKDHPEYKDRIVIDFEEDINEYCRLLEDEAVIVHTMEPEPGELCETTIPYSEIKPYLTRQAQELVLDKETR